MSVQSSNFIQVNVQGNIQVITFSAKVTVYKGQQLSEPQLITVQIACPTTKTVHQLVNGQPQVQTVQVTPEECIQNWSKLHEKIYTWSFAYPPLYVGKQSPYAKFNLQDATILSFKKVDDLIYMVVSMPDNSVVGVVDNANVYAWLSFAPQTVTIMVT